MLVMPGEGKRKKELNCGTGNKIMREGGKIAPDKKSFRFRPTPAEEGAGKSFHSPWGGDLFAVVKERKVSARNRGTS